MFGTLNPKIPATRGADATLLWSGKGLSINLANANTWTGAQTFNSSVVFNSSSANYNTFTNYSTWSNQANHYNYGTFYQYGTFKTNATPGSIPYVNSSNNITYDNPDYFRDNSLKRYGFGINTNLLSKIHVVGAAACNGSPPSCDSRMTEGTCTQVLGCSWASYNCSDYGGSTQGECEAFNPACSWGTAPCEDTWDSMTCGSYSGCSFLDCSSIGDSGTCNATSPCSWSFEDCNQWSGGPGNNGNKSACESQAGCSWSPMGVDCSSYNGNEVDCLANGCNWDLDTSTCYGTCSGVFNEFCSGGTHCQGSYETGTCDGTWNVCSGSPTPCGSFGNSIDCVTQVNCTWGQESSGYFDGDVSLAMGANNVLKVFSGATGSDRWTTSDGSATFVANSGTTINTGSTFDGYTLAQVVRALKTFGFLT